MNSAEIYLGAMSGTSCDGIDVALLDLSKPPFQVLASREISFAPALQNQLRTLASATDYNIDALYTLDRILGQAYANAIAELIAELQESLANQIIAVGIHGQTIRHRPDAQIPFSTQLACPNTIAAAIKLPVVADFRRKDIANGGQGAPLAPLFHQQAFSAFEKTIAVINIGGISNISLVTPEKLAGGFDIGPGNTLIDLLAQAHFDTRFDKAGMIAAQGQSHADWLANCLQDPYFKRPAPKSTGPEYFNLDWFESHRPADLTLSKTDIMTTATELTAQTIASTLDETVAAAYVCGGGARNTYLMQRLQELAPCQVETTAKIGIEPQLVEAATFAWLAQQTWHRRQLDLSELTGATEPACLGGVYFP